MGGSSGGWEGRWTNLDLKCNQCEFEVEVGACLGLVDVGDWDGLVEMGRGKAVLFSLDAITPVFGPI